MSLELRGAASHFGSLPLRGLFLQPQGFRLGGTEYDLSYAVQEVMLAE